MQELYHHMKTEKNLLEKICASYAAIICHNDELCSRLPWLDCLQIDSGGFILFSESNQILYKIYFILILLTFMDLVALYQKTEL